MVVAQTPSLFGVCAVILKKNKGWTLKNDALEKDFLSTIRIFLASIFDLPPTQDASHHHDDIIFLGFGNPELNLHLHRLSLFFLGGRVCNL